jgi:hypothetical protein
MKSRDRNHIIEAFNDEMFEDESGKKVRKRKESYQYLLGTMKTIGEGHQLTRASVLVLMEPSPHYHQEMQAYARIHRIGQKNKRVDTFRLIDEGSKLEESILQRQADALQFPGRSAAIHSANPREDIYTPLWGYVDYETAETANIRRNVKSKGIMDAESEVLSGMDAVTMGALPDPSVLGGSPGAAAPLTPSYTRSISGLALQGHNSPLAQSYRYAEAHMRVPYISTPSQGAGHNNMTEKMAAVQATQNLRCENMTAADSSYSIPISRPVKSTRQQEKRRDNLTRPPGTPLEHAFVAGSPPGSPHSKNLTDWLRNVEVAKERQKSKHNELEQAIRKRLHPNEPLADPGISSHGKQSSAGERRQEGSDDEILHDIKETFPTSTEWEDYATNDENDDEALADIKGNYTRTKSRVHL